MTSDPLPVNESQSSSQNTHTKPRFLPTFNQSLMCSQSEGARFGPVAGGGGVVRLPSSDDTNE